MLDEHTTGTNYEPPLKIQGNWTVLPVAGTFANNTFSCDFSRPTNPNDGTHMALNVESQPMIWAFNPASPINYDGKYFSYHEINHRGNIQSLLVSGIMIGTPSAVFLTKQIHGFGMMIVWLLLFPLAALYARYLRASSGWVFVHATIQVASVVAIAAFLFLIIPVIQKPTAPHYFIGFTLVSCVVVQICLGTANALTLRFDSSARQTSKTRYVHRYFGLAMIILAVVQCYFGLNTLYPWISPREMWPWYLVISC